MSRTHLNGIVNLRGDYNMKCVICKNGQTEHKATVVTLTRDNSVFVFKNVPADVCNNCGEQYFEEQTTQQLLLAVKDSISKGSILDIKEYKAA